jgi:hypothetical protein
MIQGYAIYLRTHRETGQQYVGCVWGSKVNWVAEKACVKRWKYEDWLGIAGLFGGFDSTIVLTEKRVDAPAMSEGLYHIRIAVDEARVMEAIPTVLCLNKISPLLQLKPNWLNEEIRKLGQQKAGRRNAVSGHMRRIGALGRTHAHQVAAGQANVTSGHIYRVNAALTADDRHRIVVLGGRAAVAAKRAKGTPIFPVGVQQRNGVRAMHRRWHILRGIVNPRCELCISKG